VVLDHLLLLGGRHVGERDVLAGQVATQRPERLHRQPLHLQSVLAGSTQTPGQLTGLYALYFITECLGNFMYVIAFTSNMFYAINAYVWKSDFSSYLNNGFKNQCVICLKCVIIICVCTYT